MPQPSPAPSKALILKPSDSQGQRGIFLIHSQKEFEEHFEEAKAFSRDKKVIVGINRGNEPFEYSVDKTMCNYFTGKYISGKQILDVDDAVILVS